MFKLESYVTPYIFAYLGKYFKNFDPSDFQMSLWGGGAVFQNLNLDLEVLDEELCLPVTFVSGHIHELKISIPWTKVTSEPIQVNINTIEITLKLKSLEENTDPFEGAKAHFTRKMEIEEPPSEAPPPGYMHNLISKILTNVHVNFENVIVKYVEEDIVLSLNIKRVSYSTADQDWTSAFVDLIAPNFELRKKFDFSDLTICLDKTNTAGKIETYQEPLLYKCSFGVRIFQQFRSPFSKIAHFTRMDFLLDHMDFSITDEQVPMLMRLYYLLRSLFEVNLKTVPLNVAASSTTFRGGGETRNPNSSEDPLEEGDEGEEGSLLDWGSWAISWLPPISAVLGEETEDGLSEQEADAAGGSNEEEKSTLLCHYGFYVNHLVVTFKALERICDKLTYGRTIKVKFLPFLKCSFQGITADFVLRGDEANYVLGVSQITVDPVGFCPCGIVDGTIAQDKFEVEQKAAQYIRVGKLSLDFAKTSMFSNPSESEDTFPSFNYNFQHHGHVEAFSEEMMLERTAAFAVEYLQTRNSLTPPPYSEEEQNYSENAIADETIDLGKDKLLIRVVLAPCYVAVCSGLVHRLKMISFAVESYNYEPYGEINRLMYRRMLKERIPGPLDLTLYKNFDEAYDVYQFTIIRPQIEVWAADHPEYSFESREKHLDQKRRIKTGTPFSHFVPNWPKLLFVAECIDGKMLDPNLKFRSLVTRASSGDNSSSNADGASLPSQIINAFQSSTETKIFGVEVSLISGAYLANLCSPCNVTYMQKLRVRQDLHLGSLDQISEKNITTEAICIQCSWAQLLLSQVIVVSAIQNIERFSEHLLASSLLHDLPNEKGSRLVAYVRELKLQQIVTVSTSTDRISIGGCKIDLEGPTIRGRLPIFVAPAQQDDHIDVEDNHWAFILMQHPLLPIKNETPEFKTEENEEDISNPRQMCLIPVFILKLLNCKMYYYKDILKWMSYSPQTIQCLIPPSVRLKKDVKIPLRPLSREGSSRKSQTISSLDGAPNTTSSNTNPAPNLSSELDSVIIIPVDGQGAYGKQSGSTGRKDSIPEFLDSHGGGGESSQGGSLKSSVPGYQLPPQNKAEGSSVLEEEMDKNNPWNEQWLLSHLNVIKNTFIHWDIGQTEVWFPLKSPFCLEDVEEGGQDDGVFIRFPKIHSQPQSFKMMKDFKEMTLPLLLDKEYFGGDLFPHRICLEEMSFGTIRENVGVELGSTPLSILVTFSLTTKDTESGSVVTTACIHTDIALVDLHLSHSQVQLFILLVEELLQSAEIVSTFSSPLLLPPIDPDDMILDKDYGEKLLISDTKSQASSYAMSSASFANTKSNAEKDPSLQFQTSYSSSIPGSASEWLNPDISGGSGQPGLYNSSNTGHTEEVQKVTCWVQMTIGMYRFSISSPPNPDSLESESLEKLVFEAEDIVSSLDIQSVFVKWSHKVSNIRLKNYEKVSKTSSWTPGKTLGILISSGDEITREIQILSSSFNNADAPLSLGLSMPNLTSTGSGGGGVTRSGTPAHQKMRGSITLTVTRVQSQNFHQKSGVPSPISKWKAAVYKFAENDYKLYAPASGAEEDLRALSEIDVQIKAIDFVFNPEVLEPYGSIIEDILNVFNNRKKKNNNSGVGAGACEDSCLLPACSNNTLPLIYLKTEAIRVFLKSNSNMENNKSSSLRALKLNTPDFILIESSAISIVSQTENPLNRTVVTPILFQMAEKARILGVPGSPVEDRQYQMDFQGVMISTGFWTDIHAKSQRTNLRSSTLLKTQGENPALEWNIRTIELAVEDVKTYPLLDRIEFSIGFAPAMVYDRCCKSQCKSYIVAGHAVEVNVGSDINLNLNLQQLRSIKQFCNQTHHLLLNFTKRFQSASIRAETPIPVDNWDGLLRKDEELQVGGYPSRSSSRGEFCDSGIDSLAHLPKIPQKRSRRTGELEKEHQKRSESHRKNTNPSPYHRHRKDRVPLDALVTSGMTTITIYDLKINSTTDDVEGVVPLAWVTVTQPHFLISASQRTQKAEVSLFQLSLKLGSASNKESGAMCWIPGPEKFDQKIFDSIPAERDAKTGMIPPFFTFKITDFLNRPCKIICDVSRPIKATLSQQRLHNILNLFTHLRGNGSEDCGLEDSSKVEILSTAQILMENQENQEYRRKFLGNISKVNVSLKQLVLCLVEGKAEVTAAFTSANLNLRIQNGHSRETQAENVSADFLFKSASVTSKLMNRSCLLVSPFNIHVHGDCCWKAWLDYPMMTIRIASDPVSLHIGPQNVLALLQVHYAFQAYLTEQSDRKDEMAEKEAIEHAESLSSKMIYDSYEDDLRAGTFKYVRVNSSAELPQVYQIGFCEGHRTMTWRYPQHRVLTSIEACPVPMDNDSPASIKCNKLECRVEYWDDAMGEFLFYGSFCLSEQESTRVCTPSKDKLHSYISTIWRIKIETALEESDSKHLVRPEILAACLKVNSIHDSSLVPKLKLFFQIPRLSINLLNNFYFGGRGPNPVVRAYSNDSLEHFDQQFATINLEMTSFLTTSWVNDSTIDCSSYVNLDVLDYEYLTLSRVLEPVLLKSSLCFNEYQTSNLSSNSNSNKLHSELDIITKNISIKFGASVLHTLLSSVESWSQLVQCWTGTHINLDKIKTLPSVNVNQIIIFNTISQEIKFLQSGADEPVSVPPGKCVPFFWPTQKAKPVCKLGVKEKDWAFSCQFDLKKAGYIVRHLHKRPIFIHVSGIGGTQKMVTVTGSLLVGNALEESLEVAILVNGRSSEIYWEIPRQGHGPSQMMNLEETEHIRFRISPKNENDDFNPWSSVVTPEDLLNSKTQSVCIPLFVETNGTLTTFSVWCTLVQETVLDAKRYLIILSPFYRVRSFLPSETIVHISTAKQGNKENYKLEGRGIQLQIDFTGSHNVTNHLTFQSNPLGSASTPSIPLLPDGPTLEMTRVERSIDEILNTLNGFNLTENHRDCPEERWPFITDPLGPDDPWVLCEQPETELEVEFAPWILGIPTVLLDVRPWALIVNLSGTELLVSLRQVLDDTDGTDCMEDEEDWLHHSIPHKSVFSPKKISLSRGRFKVGLVLNGTEVKSSQLRFSEDIYRTDVHHSNVDNIIPIDAFSRLDLPNGKQVGHLTIETRMRKKVLVITIKPTFCIVNTTDQEFMVQGLSIPSSSGRRRKSRASVGVNLEDILIPFNSQPLIPLPSEDVEAHNYCINKAHPLLTFTTEESSENSDTSHQSEIKHLALSSSGGPWWFVQLIDFSLVFNNMNSSQGVPAAALSVTIPKKRQENTPVVLKSVNILKHEELESVSIPIIISWTSKNGLVWISVSPDPFPQVVLHNQTAVSFLYVQSAGAANDPVPFREAEYFEQYLVLPPKSKSYYTFSQKYALFPQLQSEKNNVPLMLLTKLPNDLNLVQSDTQITQGIISEGSLLISGDVKLTWSKELNLDGEPFQYLCIGEFVDAKITVEKLGFTYYVYIENMSSVEVSAKDVRRRILNQAYGTKISPTLDAAAPLVSSTILAKTSSSLSVIPSTSDVSSVEMDFNPLHYHEKLKNFDLKLKTISSCSSSQEGASSASWSLMDMEEALNEMADSEPSVPKHAWVLSKKLYNFNFKLNPSSSSQEEPLNSTLKVSSKPSKLRSLRSKPAWVFRTYLPRLSFVITEDFLLSTERRELISIVIEDLFFENMPQIETREVQMLWPIQRFVVKVHIGDIQLDSPGFPFERTCDFPVILKQQKDYKRFNLPENGHIMELQNFFQTIGSSNTNTTGTNSKTTSMLSLTIKYNQQSSVNRKNWILIDTVHLISEPFCLNVEDRLVDFVFSSLQDTFRVIEDRLPLIKANLDIKHVQIQEENEDQFDDALEELYRPDSSSSSSPIVLGSTSGGSTTSNQSPTRNVNDGTQKGVSRVKMPEEVYQMLANFSHPIRMEKFRIEPLEICLTLRMARLVYLAVDHSRLKIPEFEAVSILSTSYTLGQTLAAHYTTGAIFQIGNPMRLIGSLELLGSPGSLAQSVGMGLKDFVVYPYQGIFQGPTGFLGGLGNGVTSLVKSITSGTLTSVTNWAWSVSRNLDKLTLDEEEQILTEAARRVQLHGFTDGLVQGLTGFGIRLLGAVGGIAHHPIQNVIQHGVSPSSVITGVSKGVIGVVTRPIGGIVQLVAMTGQGVLRGAGWTPQLQTKGGGGVEEMWSCASSILKYEMKMDVESILLLVHAVQLNQNRHLQPVSLIISTQNVYLIDVSEDLLVSHFPLNLARMEVNEDRNIISLRIAPPKKKDDVSFAKERIIEFVRGNSSLPFISEATAFKDDLTPFGAYGSGGGFSAPASPQYIDIGFPGGHRASSPQIREDNNIWGSHGLMRSPNALSSSSATMFTAISGSGRSVGSSCTSLYPGVSGTSFDLNSGGGMGSGNFCGSIGDFIVSPHDKSEFENVLSWAKINSDDKYFKV